MNLYKLELYDLEISLLLRLRMTVKLFQGTGNHVEETLRT